MKKYALVLCATLWLLGQGVVATAQTAKAAQASQAAAAGTAGALGNAQAVDETALSIGSQGGAQAQAGTASAGTSTLAYFLRMIVVLAFVLAAIWLVFRLMKKAQRPQVEDSAILRVLASTSLGQGRSVHVVSLGGKAWLLGSAESSVDLIAEIEDREVIDELELRASLEDGRPKADFQAVLGNLLGKGARQPKGRGKPGAGIGTDFLARQRDRLKKF